MRGCHCSRNIGLQHSVSSDLTHHIWPVGFPLQLPSGIAAGPPPVGGRRGEAEHCQCAWEERKISLPLSTWPPIDSHKKTENKFVSWTGVPNEAGSRELIADNVCPQQGNPISQDWPVAWQSEACFDVNGHPLCPVYTESCRHQLFCQTITPVNITCTLT